MGKFMIRKIIKSCLSFIRYVRDFFVFYLFCNGDSLYMLDVFDKLKLDYNNDNNEFLF